MPIYVYKCRRCGHEFEALQKLSDAPLRKCEKCRGRVDKVMAEAAVIYKGSGFYTTDYAHKSSSGNGNGRHRDGKFEPSSVKDVSEKKSEGESAKAGSDD